LKNKSVFFILAVLAIAVGVLAFINMQNAKVTGSEAVKGTILIKFNGDEKKLEFKDIKALNPVEFKATVDTSKSGPEDHMFKGVLLKDVLSAVSDEEEIKRASKVIVKAIDGYTVALSSKEIMEPDNVYLAFEKDGKPLGTKEDGGSGPYQLIVTKDQFSQRWCKFVTEVSLQ
jgi:hypothetical protein